LLAYSIHFAPLDHRNQQSILL